MKRFLAVSLCKKVNKLHSPFCFSLSLFNFNCHNFSKSIKSDMTFSRSIVNELDDVIGLVDEAIVLSESNNNRNKKFIDKKQKDTRINLNFNNPGIPGTNKNPLLNSNDVSKYVELASSVGEECVKKEELEGLFRNKRTRPIAYDGFEPSGRMHIAQGILKSICVNKLTSCGVDFVFWVADWFALLNNKMSGDLKKIQIVGKYMVEVWKAAGMNMDHVYFKWCSDEINNNSNEYWLRVVEISKQFSITRTKRCCTIMGRSESDDMPTANLMYAVMQCSDIFFLKADICQLGMDQRKVNMLAREYASKKKKLRPPIVISHHMLMGLKEGQEKMSKSDPESAIFMEDKADDVRRKIKKAYCPPKVIEKNPCLDYCKHIVFPKYKELKVKGFTITRKQENGGNITYQNYQELENDFKNGSLHPSDLKPALANAINSFLEPVRQHFENNKEAKQLLQKVRKFKTTR